MSELFLDGSVELLAGDSSALIKELADDSFDSIVTDPPYALVSIVKRFGKVAAGDATKTSDRIRNRSDGYARAASGFMGQKWDTGDVAFSAEFWTECLRVLKPGGHVLAFSGTRTYHRLAVAIEDAGFEVRDMVSWLYGSGFPKSHDVSKGIDKAAGAEREVVGHKTGRSATPVNDMRGGRSIGGDSSGIDCSAITAPATSEAAQWQGWGTALKPACEPIVLARKPLIGTVAANVLAHGTGAINVDGCRVPTDEVLAIGAGALGYHGADGSNAGSQHALGRWPANVIHDGSDEVVGAFPETAPSPTGLITQGGDHFSIGSDARTRGTKFQGHGDSGSAARFFYSSKADSEDRCGSRHPTIKPVDLMRYLCRLITPPGGLVLDPFAGSGTTGQAAWMEGFRAVLMEREEQYLEDIRRRLSLANVGPETRRVEVAKVKQKTAFSGPMFGTD